MGEEIVYNEWENQTRRARSWRFLQRTGKRISDVIFEEIRNGQPFVDPRTDGSQQAALEIEAEFARNQKEMRFSDTGEDGGDVYA